MMQLALFPLNLVVFPGEHLNLHIFEPKYRQLILEAHETGIHFGIPTYRKSKEMTLGTEVKLVSLAKTYNDGKMDIKTIGQRAFTIDSFKSKADDRLYPVGKVSFLENVHDGSIAKASTIIDLTERLYKVMKIDKELPELNQDFSVYEVAHKIGLSQNQELHLLSLTEESERQEFVLDHLQHLIPIVTEMETMRKRIQMNGHFKNEVPPEV